MLEPISVKHPVRIQLSRAKGWRKPRIVLAKQETVANALIEHMPRDALRYIADKIRDYLKED